MTKMEFIKSEWQKGFNQMRKTKVFQKIQNKEITREDYKNVLI